MRCPTCRFENMPEEEVCLQCGAALSASRGLAVDFMPPRAGGTKSWRPVRYRFNAAIDNYRDWRVWRAVSALTGIDSFPTEALGLTCLSLLPGLGHWKGHRRRGAKIAFLVWLALGVVTLNAFGSDQTGAMLGLLIAWHAVVMFDAGLRSQLATFPRRLLMMGIVLACIAMPYLWIHNVIYRTVDFVRVPLDHVACGLKADDLVLVIRRSYEVTDLELNDVVAFVSTGNGRTRARRNIVLELDTRGPVIGGVAALPRDRVELSAAGLRLNPELTGSEVVPQPGLPLPAGAVTLSIPPGHVLVPVPIQLPEGPIADTAVTDIWKRMFTVECEEIQGEALMVYQPFWRRHLIRTRG